MARSKKPTTYATAPYGLADMGFCEYIAELEACRGIRSDVRRNCVVVSVCALTRCWPASHYPKRERDRWARKATAAFRVSERELAELTGFSQKRVHNALKALFTAGFIIELAPPSHRGEGRGSTPATYALKCHADICVKSLSVSSISVSSEATDQSRPAQSWDVQ